jgi:poly-gamma-glutamate synthesis protein (capsule biosynthesis protein)
MTLEMFNLKVSAEVPAFFQNFFDKIDDQFTESITVEFCSKEQGGAVWFGEYIFAAVAQFPVVVDEVSVAQIQALWLGEAEDDSTFQKLLMSEEFEALFKKMWGDNDRNTVTFTSPERIVAALWESPDRIAIVPFDLIQPMMKVLDVDGQNPLMKKFEVSEYALRTSFCVIGGTDKDSTHQFSDIPTTNRDPEKITTLMMTGVTALTRETALKMEENGITYPAEMIKEWFDESDLIHVSNEVPFTAECPVPKIPFSASRFCSRLEYFELLEYIGVNVMELTGNHLLDYGEDAFQEMMMVLQEKEIDYYGGGSDIADAREPLSIDHNGNNLVFLGCNVPGPASVFATEDYGGANPCKIDELISGVQNAVENGQIPIVTFQHYEACQVPPMSAQREDMLRIANAGAVIVSGSQAHCPQAMTFIEGHFVHYGLGNLFFDQMWDVYRNAFLDYHVFYNGSYLGVRLFTTRLEDSSQPRPMTTNERAIFLEEIFSHCDWGME